MMSSSIIGQNDLKSKFLKKQLDVPEIKPPPITDRIEIKAVDKEKISELMIAA